MAVDQSLINQTVPDVFKNTVKQNGSSVALRTKILGLWHDITWNEYYDKASRVGCALVSMGLTKQESVCIIGDNCIEWVMVDLGIQCVGGVAVGVYATNAWQQVEYVVDHCDAKFLFVENEEQLDKWLMFRKDTPQLKKVIVWDTKGLKTFKDPMVITFDELLELGTKILDQQPSLFEYRMAKVTPEDLSVIIYTSGTTGAPKGAMLTHKNVTWMSGAIAHDTIEICKQDNVLSFLPLCHIFERLFTVFIQLKFAYTVNFVEKPDTVMQNMVEVSPTIGYAVPRIWEKYYSNIMIKMSTKIEKSSIIEAAGTKPKIIEEFISQVNGNTRELSIAKMTSPSGWVEPGWQTEFNEYTLVLRGMPRITTKKNVTDIHAGEALIVSAGEWVQYSTPEPEGAEYIAVCLPAFSPESVNRDE